MAIEMAADASSASINGSDDKTAAASRVYAPPPQPDQVGVTSSPASNRKVIKKKVIKKEQIKKKCSATQPDQGVVTSSPAANRKVIK